MFQSNKLKLVEYTLCFHYTVRNQLLQLFLTNENNIFIFTSKKKNRKKIALKNAAHTSSTKRISVPA